MYPYTIYGIISLTNYKEKMENIYIKVQDLSANCHIWALFGYWFFLNLKKSMTIIGNLNWIFYDKEFLLFTDELMWCLEFASK